MSDTVSALHRERARAWRDEHTDHVQRLLNSTDGACLIYPPSGSDVVHPELWRPPHWRWLVLQDAHPFARDRPMTDTEVMAELRSDSLLNQVRHIFYTESARIEQECMQRRKPTPIELRRMEFEAARKIIERVMYHIKEHIDV